MRKNLRRMLASLALCAVLAGTLTVSASAAALGGEGDPAVCGERFL